IAPKHHALPVKILKHNFEFRNITTCTCLSK
uniref:Uncharacterized protein n=1 Tax=Ciona savignyi TaxID=51511 RepID=H2Y5N9_CIOSA